MTTRGGRLGKARKAPPMQRLGGAPRSQFDTLAQHLSRKLQQPTTRARVKRVIEKIDAETRAERGGGKRARRVKRRAR
ncbi:MAG TPA: hypothetical protein VFX14_04285 [Methylomirabilota bacterium]|nr:hypothetical protein [Methylomirabilota bacterium]